MQIKVIEKIAPGFLKFIVSGWRVRLHVEVLHKEHRIASADARCPDPPCHEQFQFALGKEFVDKTLTINAKDVESEATVAVKAVAAKAEGRRTQSLS